MIEKDEEFMARRAAARASLNELPGNYANNSDGRKVFFDAVYERADGDAAIVPWADCAPKEHLVSWLGAHPGVGKKAIDVACGLGDNAEAIAAAGYETIAFDVVETAIDWAKKRFAGSDVMYQWQDLFELPEDFNKAFDLVHECFTIQALPEEMVPETTEAICNLVAPGGTLLVYTRWREDGTDAEGPPWPLEERNLDLPRIFGLRRVNSDTFTVERQDGQIPHRFEVWVRD